MHEDAFRTDAFDYALPPELIAQRPAEQRDRSRLLYLPADGPLQHHVFDELPALLRPGDLLAANDTRVVRARFRPARKRGGKAEVLLLHPAAEAGTWEATARPGKRVRKGDRLSLDDACGIEVVDWAPDGNRIVRFYGVTADEAMQRFGEVPLPPYIDRPPDDASERYQTVYATTDGSVAAPTAGLHFTPELLRTLADRDVGWTTVTLDVGAGTFRPVSEDDIRRHHMHAERYEIPPAAADAIRTARAQRRRVIAVGTTALRTLEASAAQHGEVVAGAERTSIFIYPPYAFRAVDALITNFHLPRSTLLMLVSAFAGRERVLAAYAEAIASGYRFYSFGDAMLIERHEVDG